MKHVKAPVVILLWVATAVAAYLGPAAVFVDRIEGLSSVGQPWLPSIVFGILLIASLVASILWAKNLTRKTDSGDPELASARRRFLTGGAAVAGGAVVAGGVGAARFAPWGQTVGQVFVPAETTAPDAKQAWSGAAIQSYRPLGNTGLMVSDIAAGSTRLHQNADPIGFLNALLDRGVNYIDASPDYAPQSEEIIRKAIKGRDRSKLVLATKFCHQDGHLREGSSVSEYMTTMEKAISRLGTDYIDVAHIHACDSVGRLMDENVHEAVDRLREQGKVRFMGVSTHTPNLEEVANTAIDSGRFQVMMLAYHHGAWPQQTEIIERAHANGVGIVAMKTLKGAKHNGLAGFHTERDSYTQAAFKWVLSNPHVSNLVISFFNDQHLDEYLYASGQALTSNDVAVLDKYDSLIAGTHCFQHCNACQGACPEALPIHDVLRHRMYFEDYGDQKQAMNLYAQLERNAAACLSCNAPCTGVCPEGIPIKARMLGAHEMLT